MKPSTRFLAWTATAWVISASASAQTPPPPAPGAEATPGQSNSDRSDPSTSTPSTINRSPDRAISEESAKQSRNQDTDMSRAAEQRPKVGREARLGGISAGSIVQSPAGENIGRVKDIVPDANTGEPAYIVIASRSGSTAVPYASIAPMYQNGHVVLDRTRLESAPHVTEDQLRNDTKDASWKRESDRYWESRHPPRLE
jgi:hypothetical protein